MNSSGFPRRGAAFVLVATAVAGSLGATWPPEKFNNLKVLPADIPQQELIRTMGDYTRALGVRCTYCHVGEEGQRLSAYDFESDEKATKRKAREMIRMVNDLNGKYLAGLEHRVDPPLRVECVTCHRGATEPRMLEDVLLHAHQVAGADSALAVYRRLRDESYGRFTYDFGSVPLTVVAAKLQADGKDEDALRFLALNVEMNPKSVFAMRQHAAEAVDFAFRGQGRDAGVRTYRELRERYGAEAFPEFALNRLGYGLLGDDHADLAIAAFQLNTEAYPKSGNAYDSLGEAYAKHGDRDLALESYRKAVELDPKNDHAKKAIEALEDPAKR